MHYRTKFAHARRLPLLVRLAIICGIAAGLFVIAESVPFGGTSPDKSVQYCKTGLGDNSDWVWYCSKSPISVLPASPR
jgi:hypothetical protein